MKHLYSKSIASRKWTLTKLDYRAVEEHGQAWEKIGLRVGRMPSDCRDRYRNHIVNRDIRVTGLSFYSDDFGVPLICCNQVFGRRRKKSN